MGIDPKKLNALAQPATSKSGDSKTKANSTLDPMLLDPITAAALGHDPKNPKFDPMLLASLGLDPKNPKSTILAAMAAMDPNHQLAAMNEMMPPGFPGMPGMDMFGKGGKASATAKDTKSPHHAPSPRGSSQQDGPSPHPPSKASASSRDGRDNKDGRSTPSESSAPSMPQASGRALSTSSAASMAGMFGGMNQTLFGLGPEMQTSMDPKLLQAAGIDPKMLSSLNPKMLK